MRRSSSPDTGVAVLIPNSCGRFLLDFSAAKPQLVTVTYSVSDSHTNRRGGESKQLFLLSSRVMPTSQLSMSLLASSKLCVCFSLVTQILHIKASVSGLLGKPSSLTQGNAIPYPPCSPSPETCSAPCSDGEGTVVPQVLPVLEVALPLALGSRAWLGATQDPAGRAEAAQLDD